MSLPLTTLFVVGMTTSATDDWPQFGGPAGNNTSPETGLARSFPDGGPPVLWTAELQDGYAGAAVSNGEVFIIDRIVGETDVLRVMDLATGEELWRFEHAVPGRLMFPGARSVPTVTPTHVYMQGAFGQISCIDRNTHEAVWMTDLQEEFGGAMPMFGYANSPLLHDDLVYVTPLGAEIGLVALDGNTGDVAWTSSAVGSSHSTPCMVDLLDQTQILLLTSSPDMSNMPAPPPQPELDADAPPPPTFGSGPPVDSLIPEDMADFTLPGTGLLTAFTPDGETLWTSDAYYCSTPIPTPIRVDDEHVFITGGYAAGSVMLRLEETDDGITPHEVFRIEKGAQVHLPLLHDGHLYVIVNENANDPRRRRNQGGLMCLDLEGNEQWRTGSQPYLGRGHMLLADGLLVVQDGRSGTLILVEPTPEEYRPIAEASIFGIDDRKDHQMWAPMALADGHLLMRSQTELKCVDLRAR